MFWQINPPATAPPVRHAEETDTRQAIQRHDPDRPGRKNGDEKARSEEEAGNSIILSLDALHEFLIKFLGENGAQSIDNDTIPQTNLAAQSAIIHHNTGQSAFAAKAAHAYGNTKKLTAPSTVLLETTDTGASGPEFSLTTYDTQAMRVLISDIEQLLSLGTEHIAIARAETFLQSLINAVSQAKLAAGLTA